MSDTTNRQAVCSTLLAVSALLGALAPLASAAATSEPHQSLLTHNNNSGSVKTSTEWPPPTTTTTTATTTTTTSSPDVSSSRTYSNTPQCQLGNDSYQLGERWNPNLPPFGVQVCVLCECIARFRKHCYEAKVICRRITNECPLIDSCPDGNKPVTLPGQCCKSCGGGVSLMSDAPATPTPSDGSSRAAAADQQQQQLVMFKNERVKEQQQPPQVVLGPKGQPMAACPANLRPPAEGSSLAAGQPPPPHPGSTKYKAGQPGKQASGAGKNELNGIDTRRAFKSLDGQFSMVLVGSGAGKPGPIGGNRMPQQQQQPADDQTNHPNDVQSGSPNFNQVNYQEPNTNRPHLATTTTTTTSNRQRQQQQQQPPRHNTCLLGNETFHIGDRWNPFLPGFGVQVCVQCNCIVRVMKRTCYEAKVICRRTQSECAPIESCPDGREPIAVAGQCCKSCPPPSSSLPDQQPLVTNSLALATTSTTTTTATSSSNPTLPSSSSPSSTTQTKTTSTTNSRASELRTMREYHIMMRDHPSCSSMGTNSNGNSNSNSNKNPREPPGEKTAEAPPEKPSKRSIRM